ncbi:MAG: ABC transporter ATP-binding protein [Planctomycetaceae bacterium]
MIVADRVTKTYRRGTVEVPVLRELSCEIDDGAFAFIVGPSGSGKSTLLYLLGMLDRPTSGEILIGGRKLSAIDERERNRLRRDEIGFIFQSFNLLSNLSAVDNVLAPYLTHRREAAGKRSAAIAMLQHVGLGDRLEHRSAELSGGEQQRVAIARALLKRPSLILADEPTGELDSENGAEVFRLLRSLHEELHTTVAIVTHDQRYIEPDDPVLEIRDGRIAREGSVTTR